jgi:aquaporin Z
MTTKIKTLTAEALGSGWLLLCVCGTAVLAAGFPLLGVGFEGIALAWGLGTVTAGYGTGGRAVAGLTPVMAVGMWCAGELSLPDCLLGIAAQVAGSVAGAGVLWLMVRQIPSFDVSQGFCGNGYDALSPGGFPLFSVLLAEAVVACFVVLMTLGSGTTFRRRSLVAGGCMALGAMLTVTVDNAALSPARSTAVAVFAGGEWLGQLWAFWLAPLAGAAAGGGLTRRLRHGGRVKGAER